MQEEREGIAMQKLNENLNHWEVRWRRLSPRKQTLAAAAALTACVLAFFGVLLATVTIAGSGLIFSNDDYHQHYPFLLSIGRWLKSFFTNPAEAPLIDFTLGFGADWLGSMNYYGAGDPLTLLAALFPESATYSCYVLLTALRLVLAGWAFLTLCRVHRLRWRGALPAAMGYVFTTYVLSNCIFRHPFFLNPLIHLPLMLSGVELRLQNRSPALLILSTAWSAMCGFYFLYMNSVLLFVYALARHFCTHVQCGPWKTLPAAFLRALIPYLLGLCIASVFLLPGVLGYLSCGRGDLAYRDNLLFFDAPVYWSWPTSFVASNGWYQSATVPVAALLAFAALMGDRKRSRCLAFGAVAAAVALLVPVIGWAFNGFSYVSDRWKYGVLLLYCYILAAYAPSVEEGRRGLGLCAGLALWSGVLLARRAITGSTIPHVALIFLAGLLSVGGLADILAARRLHRRLTSYPALRRAASGALLCAFILVNLLSGAAVITADLLLGTSSSGDALRRHQQTSLLASPRTESFSRTDLTHAEYFRYNAPVFADVNSTSVYTSIRPASTAEFMQGLQLNTEVSSNRTHGLDSRAALEAIWSVRYLTAPSEGNAAIPYGFELLTDDGTRSVWENRYALPVAYPMDSYLTQAEYDALPAVERQWALLYHAVADVEEGAYLHGQWSPVAQDVPWTLAASENAALENGRLTFDEGGGSVTLSFEGLPHSETYLQLQGLTESDPDGEDRRYLLLDSHGDESLLEYAGDGYEYSLRRRDFLNHLGYSAQPRTEVILRSEQQASFTFDSLQILSVSMEGYEARVAQLNDGTVRVTQSGPNVFTAETDFDRAQMLVFSLPALEGWNAFIDGEEVALSTSASALCMVETPRGQHTVTLRYRAPGLLPGLALTVSGVTISALWLSARVLKRRVSKH